MAESTFAGLVASFCEFLLVAIHTIIHEREIYPSTLFLAARKYNHPVRQARHPRVCRWIQDAVDACSEELIKGTVSRVCLVIISTDNLPLERFVFDVSAFPSVPIDEVNAPFRTQDSPEMDFDPDSQYRAALVKLSLSAPKLGKLPSGCSFSVAIELKDDVPPPEGNPPPWIVAESKGELLGQGKPGDSIVRSIPVRTVDAGPLLLEIFIEEGNTKEQLQVLEETAKA